jgi:glycosyltransferase involved in cell wall biosynthesis
MKKEIDVIIPAYKAHKTIARTLASIAAQTIASKVVVTIVNDADEKGYEQYKGLFGNLEINVVDLKTNGGPGVARQVGMNATKCPFVTFIDADDTFAGAFALEILLKGMEDAAYHTVVGGFAEEQPGLHFVSHQNDLIWMFGKLYRRSFLDKYKIRFNETRANEDNGFNTFVRLVSSEQEKVMFIPDIVYYWHWKEDSITRINNAQYSYDQSFVGYVDNMIYAIKSAKKLKPFNNYIDMWSIQVMAQLYIYYYQTVRRDPRFTEQNYSYCVKYYEEVFSELWSKYGIDGCRDIFGETLAQRSHDMMDIVPDKAIHQFIEDLNNENGLTT